MFSVPVRTPETMEVRLIFISRNAVISSAVSSRPLGRITVCRSPEATVRAMLTASRNGWVMLRINQAVINTPESKIPAIAIHKVMRVS